MMKSMAKAMKASGMKKMMKSMAKEKSMAMRKKAMKKTAATYKTKQGAKSAVFKGLIMKSKGGLKKDALTKNKNGRIVSKKLSLKGKKSKWMAAVAKARAALKVKGFMAVGGKTAAGAFLHRLHFLILAPQYIHFIYI